MYSHAGELADPVAEYLAAGFELGEPAVVVATPEHWAQFARGLTSRGWDVVGVTRSPITGPEGNVEFLLAAVRSPGGCTF